MQLFARKTVKFIQEKLNKLKESCKFWILKQQ